MIRLAILMSVASDLSHTLQATGEADVLSFEEAGYTDLQQYDALAVLGGTESRPVVLPIDTRLAVEDYMTSCKPVFLEWCASFALTFTDGDARRQTDADRLIWVGEETPLLRRGDLLDDHAGLLAPPFAVPSGAKPLLYNGGHVMKHEHTDAYDPSPPSADWALWYYAPHVLVTSFPLANWIRARYAPSDRWTEIVRRILQHLRPSAVLPPITPYCRLAGTIEAQPSIEIAFERGMHWLQAAGIYLNEGRSGVLEGLSHTIHPDGRQEIADGVRADCSGEVAGACFFDFLLHDTADAKERFAHLAHFTLNKMRVMNGPCAGMIRWTTLAYGICYQDDVARAILGFLLAMHLTKDRTYLPPIEAALDFLLRSTGTDGLRISRTDMRTLDEAAMAELRSRPANFPCAHFNAYYAAVLLLAYQLNGRVEYRDTAIRGLSTIMAAYPHTIREHSETQELCRLLFPLACLYDVTKDPLHLTWLHTVADRLDTFRHASGGYVEYDTGYTAKRSRTSGTESSLLADNGDAVSDLLYSANWLPLAFAYAWRVTGEAVFHDRWTRIARFMAAVQTISDDPMLHGSWNRGIDLTRMEAYGIPHDIGWGPCCVESGWTVGEILMGLGLGLTMERGLLPK